MGVSQKTNIFPSRQPPYPGDVIVSDQKKNTDWKLLLDGESREAFSEDIDRILGLSDKDLSEIREFYLKRDEPYSILDDDEEIALQKRVELTGTQLSSISRCLTFIIQSVVLGDLSVEDITSDLEQLERGREDLDKFNSFISSLVSVPSIDLETRKAASEQSIIATVDSFTCSIDARAVYGKEDEIIGVVPVLIACLVIDGQEKKQEIVFQLSKNKLDQLYNMLGKHKKRLDDFNSRIELQLR